VPRRESCLFGRLVGLGYDTHGKRNMCSGERTGTARQIVVVSDYRDRWSCDRILVVRYFQATRHDFIHRCWRFRLCLTGEEISITPSAGSMFQPVLFARYRGRYRQPILTTLLSSGQGKRKIWRSDMCKEYLPGNQIQVHLGLPTVV
jgi:hypothetical protein